MRPRNRRLPVAPAALLPAPARAVPGELRARHQSHAGGRGGARARAADAARGLLPQRERGRPAPPACRVPAPGAARRAQRSYDPRPAPARPARAWSGRPQAAPALVRGTAEGGASGINNPGGSITPLSLSPSSEPQFPRLQNGDTTTYLTLRLYG